MIEKIALEIRFICVQNRVLLISSALEAALIVIINSKFLKRYSKTKCPAPDYPRVLSQVRGVVNRMMPSGGPNPVAREPERRQSGC